MHEYSGGNRKQALGGLAVLSVVLAWVTGVVAAALSVGPAWLLSAPTVAASFGILYTLVDRYLWRVPGVRFVLGIDTPVIEGAYHGNLTSSFEHLNLPITIKIDQSWTRVVVKFEVVGNRSSASRSIAASLTADGHHDARLIYTYKNTVNPATSDEDMADHDGTAELVITAGGNASGRYFNYRGRQGDLRLDRETAESAEPSI